MALGMLHRWPWVQLALTLPVVLYSGAGFYAAAWTALRHRSANMNSLIALGTGTAFLYSVYETARGGHEVYFEAAAVIIALILTGRLLEARARAKAGAAIRRLMDLEPPRARVLRDGAEVEVPVAEVRRGDTVVVRPGERIPVDGAIVAGESAIDESMLTGESMPVEKGPGGAVFAGAFNRSGSFRFTATQVGQRHGAAADDRNGAPGARRARAGGAAGGRGERLLHAGRAGGRGRHVRGVAFPRAVRHGHGERGSGADYRLPVRAGAGHAHRHHGRHRARRRARHPD